MAKSLLDVSDNFERALEAVPSESRDDKEGNPVLASLYEGISMTESLLIKSFSANGIEKFGDPGDAFDPNMHEAMFEYEDGNFEGGQVGQVMKKGFKLNGRDIRSCQVGVVKK
jgi:molecular chaperone GrpE